jgi:DNA mismatch repair protein MutS
MLLTPIRRQYLQIKKQYPGAIVLFRLGDFYETFDEDAKIAARELDLVLTSRPVAKGQRVPMAGVPYHAVEGYIARLIAKGYKVAICEQTSETPVKGLMARQVVRVITPGTVVEPTLLDDKRNNYLAALVIEGDPSTSLRAGLAYADITTGEFAATQVEAPNVVMAVQRELERLHPAELLIPESQISNLRSQISTPYDDWHFDLDTARQVLLDHFGVASLEGYGCAGLPLAIRAAGAIVQYLGETQKAAQAQLTALSTYSTSGFMVLDAAARRNLELTETIRTGSAKGSLLGVLDLTATSMGGRLLRRWLNQPLLDHAELEKRLDAVEAFYRDTPRRTAVRELLRKVSDLERLTNRVVQGIASPRDLIGLKASLEAVPKISETGMPLASQLDPCPEVVTLIAQAIVPNPPATLSTGGVIAPGFSAELDGLVAATKNAKNWIASLERTERQRTGIKTLKVGYNKVFGYYIEVTQANLSAVPSDYVRKQTLTNAERFITPELKEQESLILNAQERMSELEMAIFRQVGQQIAASADRILMTARALAQLDVFAALAEVTVRNRYVRPTLTDGDEIHIVAGRHPVVELALRDEPFVPNDVHLSPEEEILVLTGPNMSGKSTCLRQVALIVLMAQIGLFVPADEATIGLVDRIFTRIGAQDEIAAGQSTFMVEMIETSLAITQATSRSLLIFDEIGRGTSTYDGLAIAWAVVEYIHNHPRLRAKTLFATHYHELTELAKTLPHVRNYNVAVAEEGGKVIFLHKIVPGGADKSYGIHVAQLAGLPRSIIARAEAILQELESNSRGMEGPKGKPLPQQLKLFGLPDPVLEELKQLDVSQMTPLEAIGKLYELQQKAKSRG